MVSANSSDSYPPGGAQMQTSLINTCEPRDFLDSEQSTQLGFVDKPDSGSINKPHYLSWNADRLEQLPIELQV